MSRKEDVDNFIKNIKFDVDVGDHTDYIKELKENVNKYQKAMVDNVEALKIDLKVQKTIIDYLKKLDNVEDIKVQAGIETDINKRSEILDQMATAIKFAEEKIKLYNDVIDLIDNHYDILLLIDKYFDRPLSLQETLDFIDKLKNEK